MKTGSLALFCIFFSISLSAQTDRTNFRAGLNGGLVTGDFSDAYSFVLGLDIYQHWGVSKKLDLGIASGFSNAFGEKERVSAAGSFIETEFDNVQFIPVAASLRIYPISGFKLGGDVGYAIGINEGNEGGFYYRPSIGVDINGGITELNVSYMSVGGDVAFSSLLLGVLFLF